MMIKKFHQVHHKSNFFIQTTLWCGDDDHSSSLKREERSSTPMWSSIVGSNCKDCANSTTYLWISG